MKAEIIAHSTNKKKDELITFILTFPRFILAELNTHRMFSRNSASSRAIPFSKMKEAVENNPFIPIAWQKKHKGMQGNFYEKDRKKIEEKIKIWKVSSKVAIHQATLLHDSDTTKQLANRLLEPYLWHTAIITTGIEGLNNFFKQRLPLYEDSDGNIFYSKEDFKKFHNHSDNVSDFLLEDFLILNKGKAEIHISTLAEEMYKAYIKSIPKSLKEGEFHRPFYGNIYTERLFSAYSDYMNINLYHPTSYTSVITDYIKNMIYVARCARISYNNFKGKIDYISDIDLYHKLLKDGHWSPFEHVAVCMNEKEYNKYTKSEEKGWCRNFKGYIQLREFVEKDNLPFIL